MATWRQCRPAASTRRLKPSFSASPCQTRAKVSPKASSTLAASIAPAVDSTSKSCTYTGALSTDRRYGRSAITRRPMFSIIGSASDSGMSSSWRYSFRRRPSPDSRGTACRLRRRSSGPVSASSWLTSLAATAVLLSSM
ncbi:hypothetical protein D3C71_1123480 [compost metagenome]